MAHAVDAEKIKELGSYLQSTIDEKKTLFPTSSASYSTFSKH